MVLNFGNFSREFSQDNLDFMANKRTPRNMRLTVIFIFLTLFGTACKPANVWVIQSDAQEKTFEYHSTTPNEIIQLKITKTKNSSALTGNFLIVVKQPADDTFRTWHTPIRGVVGEDGIPESIIVPLVWLPAAPDRTYRCSFDKSGNLLLVSNESHQSLYLNVATGVNGDHSKMQGLAIASISCAFAGLVVGLLAAYYWFKASRVKIDPGWRSVGPPQSAADALKSIEPADPVRSQSGWVMATMESVTESAHLNKIAACWTAVAVVLSAVSSALGALAGCFR